MNYSADQNPTAQPEPVQEKTPQEKADEHIREVEMSKARLFGLTGREPNILISGPSNLTNITDMDNS